MQDLIKETTEQSVKVMASLSANYVKGVIMGVMIPMLTDALKEGLEDAKDEVKGGEESKGGRAKLEDRLAKDLDEQSLDTNLLYLESTPTQWVWFGPDWTGYRMFTVKFGTDKKKKEFYAVGYDVTLRHTVMQQLDKGLREEYKEVKEPALPVLPPDCMHGTKCFCMVRVVDAHTQYGLFKQYFDVLAQKPFCHSKSAAQLFRIGDDWKAQALFKEIFDQAVIDTVEDFLGRPACKWCEFKDPFDETEAIRQLLYLVASTTVLPRLRGMINPPVCARNARLTAESTIIGILNTAADGWAASQPTLDKVKKEAIQAVTDAGQALVEKLKPHLIKVLEKVNSKVKKGGDKKEAAPVVKPGDVTANWRFDRTAVGAKLHTAFGTSKSADAIRAAESDLNPRGVLEAELRGIAEALGGEGMADVPGIKDAIAELSGKINDQIYRFNTLGPLLGALRALAEVRDDMEGSLSAAAGKPDEVVAEIKKQQAALWDTGLAKSVMKMFVEYNRIRGNVKSAYAGDTPEKAATAMIEFCDDLFNGHVMALNSVRVRYITLLQAALVGDGIASADSIKERSKGCFRQAVFEVADILMDDFWVKMSEKIVLFAQATAFAKFKANVWPEMQEILEPIKSVLPEPVAKVNVHEKIILKIIEVVINKAMGVITTKLLCFAERKLFTQA
jgi:hypothetical protein